SLLFLRPVHYQRSHFSLHDALPISEDVVTVHDGAAASTTAPPPRSGVTDRARSEAPGMPSRVQPPASTVKHSVRIEVAFIIEGQDRKSTRLNSSHEWISYAVFCLKT